MYYGYQHKALRKALLTLAIGTLCPMCGQVMDEGQALDLDHTIPLILGGDRSGDRIVHASCNRSAGAALGNSLRANRSSRDW